MLRNRLVRLSGDNILWIPSLNLVGDLMNLRCVYTCHVYRPVTAPHVNISFSAKYLGDRLETFIHLFTKTIDIFLLAFSSCFFFHFPLLFHFFSILLYIILYFQHDRSSQKRNNIYFVFSFSFFFLVHILSCTHPCSLFFSFLSFTLFHSFHIHSFRQYR